jgi:hypothetical protein
MREPELLTPLPEPVLPLSRVRSTLVVASVSTIRRLGHFDLYSRALPDAHRAVLSEAVAGTWLTVESALAHYEACDALGLSEQQQVTIGRSVGEQIRGTLTGAMVSVSKHGGVTPWSLVAVMPRVWGRVFEGSALGIWKLGPKEIRLDALEMPLFGSRYFRNAFRGQAMVALDLFCTKSYVVDLHAAKSGAYSFRGQWA